MPLDIKIDKKIQSEVHNYDLSNIPFGQVFSDHMLYVEYNDGEWKQPTIMPYQELSLSPAISGLHYGQSIFEGLKAYKTPDNKPVVFRPHDNFKRMNMSARRMSMPEIPEEVFMDGMKKLIDIDQAWIPQSEGSALYIRPIMFACDKYVGIKPSDNYIFLIFTCPVGPYYPKPLKVKIEQKYVRAFKGGVGYAKVAGNYGAALHPTEIAQKDGYDQLIWTDGVNFREIQESGTMNIFFVIDGKTVTPPANDGTILEGITRNSIIELLKHHNYPVEERKITVDEVLQAWKDKKLEEVFGSGTAATIAHISHIGHDDKQMELPDIDKREVSNFVFNRLENIKTGKEESPFDWLLFP